MPEQSIAISPPAASLAAAATDGQPVAEQRPPWVPIRSLASRHRPLILRHLTALSDADRYLRFGYGATDEQMGRYVAGLDFDRDEVFGVFNRRLELVALAHLAYPLEAACATPTAAAEFGGSVLERQRGRGHGSRLFEHAMLHARNRGLQHIYIHALSENAAMLHIARRAGATVQRDGPESEAFLRLPAGTLASQVEQVISEGAAVLDYQFKSKALMVDAVAEVIADVRHTLGGADSELPV